MNYRLLAITTTRVTHHLFDSHHSGPIGGKEMRPLLSFSYSFRGIRDYFPLHFFSVVYLPWIFLFFRTNALCPVTLGSHWCPIREMFCRGMQMNQEKTLSCSQEGFVGRRMTTQRPSVVQLGERGKEERQSETKMLGVI